MRPLISLFKRFFRRRLVLPLVLLLALLLIATACRPGDEPPPAPVCDPLCVGERFAPFYEAQEGELLFGRPRSREIVIDPGTSDERLVQFFDNVRLDLDPNSGDVVVARLGEWAYAGRPDEPVNTDETPALEGAFQAFYDLHNGAELFGRPLSPLMQEGDLKVQYFENVRLEWHPGAPAGRQVVVSLLGRAQYLKEYFEPALIAQPVDAEQLEALIVEASVHAPVLYAGEEQVIYVTALTPDRQPVRNAGLQLTLRREGTEPVELELDVRTDTAGSARVPIDLPDLPAGEEISIEISAYWRSTDPLGSAVVSFETWW